METQINETPESKKNKTRISKEDWIKKLENKLVSIPALFTLYGLLGLGGGIYLIFINIVEGLIDPYWNLLWIMLTGVSYVFFAQMFRKKQNITSVYGLTVTAGLNLLVQSMIFIVFEQGRFSAFIINLLAFYYSFRSIDILRQLIKQRNSELSTPHL